MRQSPVSTSSVPIKRRLQRVDGRGRKAIACPGARNSSSPISHRGSRSKPYWNGRPAREPRIFFFQRRLWRRRTKVGSSRICDSLYGQTSMARLGHTDRAHCSKWVCKAASLLATDDKRPFYTTVAHGLSVNHDNEDGRVFPAGGAVLDGHFASHPIHWTQTALNEW